MTGPTKKTGNTTKYPVGRTGNVVSPITWQEFTEKNLDLANRNLKKVRQSQSVSDGILAQTASNLKTQKDLTDRAFDRRIEEVKEAKQLLEQQLSETIVKIGEMEENIIALEKAVDAKQGE